MVRVPPVVSKLVAAEAQFTQHGSHAVGEVVDKFRDESNVIDPVKLKLLP